MSIGIIDYVRRGSGADLSVFHKANRLVSTGVIINGIACQCVFSIFQFFIMICIAFVNYNSELHRVDFSIDSCFNQIRAARPKELCDACYKLFIDFVFLIQFVCV